MHKFECICLSVSMELIKKIFMKIPNMEFPLTSHKSELFLPLIFGSLFCPGNETFDEILTVLFTTSMFVGTLIGFVLDNVIPGQLVHVPNFFLFSSCLFFNKILIASTWEILGSGRLFRIMKLITYCRVDFCKMLISSMKYCFISGETLPYFNVLIFFQFTFFPSFQVPEKKED